MLTYEDYMKKHAEISAKHNVCGVPSKECLAEQMQLHRQYYAQMVSQYTINHVVSRIGHDVLVNAKDRHLNDIPIQKWDRVVIGLPLAIPFKLLGDFATPAGLVCVAKEAARQYIELQKGASC